MRAIKNVTSSWNWPNLSASNCCTCPPTRPTSISSNACGNSSRRIVCTRPITTTLRSSNRPSHPVSLKLKPDTGPPSTPCFPTASRPSKNQKLCHGRVYLDLAASLLGDPLPRLFAVGGLSGSGKSTVAAALAPLLGLPPGARILSSDRIRKRLHGVRPEQRLPIEAYRPEISARVYATMREAALEALRAGCAAVADAVFDRPGEREIIEDVARAAGAPFDGIWLEAPIGTLTKRLEARTHDPSDATADVLAGQLRRDLGAIAWSKINAGKDVGETAAEALRMGEK